MKPILFTAILLTGTAVTAGPLVTPLSGSVGGGTQAIQGAAGDVAGTGVPATLPIAGQVVSTQTIARVFDGADFDSSASRVEARATSSALWNNAKDGIVTGTWGWTINGPGGGTAFTGGAPLWRYSFTVASRSQFVMTYNVASLGDSRFGLNPLWIASVGNRPGDGNYMFLGDVFDPTGAGQILINLKAGETYDLRLQNGGNVNFGGSDGLNALAGYYATWSIAAVPEPASWALLVAGFGLIGAASRRRPAGAARALHCGLPNPPAMP